VSGIFNGQVREPPEHNVSVEQYLYSSLPLERLLDFGVDLGIIEKSNATLAMMTSSPLSGREIRAESAVFAL